MTERCKDCGQERVESLPNGSTQDAIEKACGAGARGDGFLFAGTEECLERAVARLREQLAEAVDARDTARGLATGREIVLDEYKAELTAAHAALAEKDAELREIWRAAKASDLFAVVEIAERALSEHPPAKKGDEVADGR